MVIAYIVMAYIVMAHAPSPSDLASGQASSYIVMADVVMAYYIFYCSFIFYFGDGSALVCSVEKGTFDRCIGMGMEAWEGVCAESASL